jgi:hypothetical protein
MPGAFQYRPKFVDIRVKPPKADEPDAEDVNALKPGERACDHAGCRRAATARAPKSREMMNEHYWFCQEHAAEYNRNWNFFAGMSEGEMRAFQKDELFTLTPFTSTVQAPHWPWSQPFFEPVRRRCSRSASRSVVRGSRSSALASPLTVIVVFKTPPPGPGIKTFVLL